MIAENHRDNLLSFGFDQVKIAHSAEEATVLLETFQPELLLVDVRLRNRAEGINWIEEVQVNRSIPFIYLTAHSDEKTLERMLGTKPAAYLSKPIRKADLYSAVKIALQNSLEQQESEGICLEDGGTKICFVKNELVYVQSNGNYVQLFFKSKPRQLVRMTMEGVLSALNDDNFVKINRSQIVNIREIEKVKGKLLWMKGIQMNISPHFIFQLKERLGLNG